MAAALAAAGVAPPLIAAVDRALDGMRVKACGLDADLLSLGQALLEDIGAVEAASPSSSPRRWPGEHQPFSRSP